MWASRMPRPITAPMVTKPARTPFTVSSVRRALPPPSDGQLAEDGPRDVAETGHHHAHRRRHPNELPLSLDRSDDGVGHLVRSHGQRCRTHAPRHLRLHEPRTHHQHMHAMIAERVTEAEKEAVEARLGRPVDEVGWAHTLT